MPIVEECLNALVGQRVLLHLLEHGEGDRGDVRADPRGLGRVLGVAKRGRDHLGGQVEAIEQLDAVGDELNAVLADVVEPPNKR